MHWRVPGAGELARGPGRIAKRALGDGRGLFGTRAAEVGSLTWRAGVIRQES